MVYKKRYKVIWMFAVISAINLLLHSIFYKIFYDNGYFLSKYVLVMGFPLYFLLGAAVGLLVSRFWGVKHKGQVFFLSIFLFFIFVLGWFGVPPFGIWGLVGDVVMPMPTFLVSLFLLPLVLIISFLERIGIFAVIDEQTMRPIVVFGLLIYSLALSKLILLVFARKGGKNERFNAPKSKNLFFLMFFLVLIFVFLVVSVRAIDSNPSDNGLSVTFSVVDTKEVGVSIVPVDFNPSEIQDFKDSSEKDLEFMGTVYPLSEGKFHYRIQRDSLFESNVGHTFDAIEDILLIIRIYRENKLDGQQGFDRVVGLVPEGWFSSHNYSAEGVSFRGFKGALVEPNLRHGVAHELAHTIGFGLCDEYQESTWNFQDGYALNLCPNGDLNPLDGKLDEGCAEYKTGCPTTTLLRLIPWYESPDSLNEIDVYNFMGNQYFDNERWIRKDSYDYLLEKFSEEDILFSEDNNTLLITGLIFKNNTVVLDTSYVLNSSSFINESESLGNYSIRLMQGDSLYYINSFEPVFVRDSIGGESEEINYTGFIFVLPYSDNVTQIIVQNSTDILTERNVSANTPVVNINTSINGQAFSDKFIVSWNGSDADNDNLTYSVLLSNDGGKNFTTIALDINYTNLTVENSFLENGSQYVVKVMATDGVRTGVGTNSVSFSVQPDPLVELVSPADDTVLIDNNVLFRYKTSVLDAEIKNCSLYLNDLFNKTNGSAIIQGEVMNFSTVLVDGSYNWTVKCTDTRGYIGESEVRALGISKVVPKIIDWGATPNPWGFGDNITIWATLNTSGGVDKVVLNVTRPNGIKSSYSVNNISVTTWAYNFTDNINGTYNFTFFVNYTNGLETSEGGSFDLLSNLITSCGILNTAGMKYALVKNLSSAGTCLNITANNIVVDGNGFFINYAQSTGGDGLSIKANFTLTKNLRFYLSNVSRTSSKGIRIIKSNYVNVTNVGIYSSCYSSSNAGCDGILLQDSSNSFIYDVAINTTTSHDSIPLLILSSSSPAGLHHKVVGAQLVAYGGLSSGFEALGQNNGVDDISLENSQVYSSSYYGIYVDGGSDILGKGRFNATNISVTSKLANRYALYLTDSEGGAIKDSTFSNINAYDIWLANGDHDFVNSSFADENVAVPARLTRRWYYRAYINYTDGPALYGVNVTAYNVSGKYQFNLTTLSTGYSGIAEIIDYVNIGGSKIYYSPYTIFANKDGQSDSHTYNATLKQNNMKDVFSLNLDHTSPVVTLLYPQNITYDLNITSINYTVTEIHPDRCWYSNSSGLWNSSSVSSGVNFTIFLYLDGSYNFRVYCNDTSGNVGFSSVVFSIKHFFPNDTDKLYIQNSTGSNVAWLGSEGNIVLKGSCISGGVCNAPVNSFVIGNASDNTTAYIDMQGNLCVEKGDCSFESASCNPSKNALIIRDSANVNMSYIDFDGDLCLRGKLYQNSNP